MGGERRRSGTLDRETDDERLARLLQPGPRHARVRGRRSAARTGIDAAADDRPTLEQPIVASVGFASEPESESSQVRWQVDRPAPDAEPRSATDSDRAVPSPEQPDRDMVSSDAGGGLGHRLTRWRFGGPQLAVIAVIVVVGVLLATWAVLRARPVAIATPDPSVSSTSPVSSTPTPAAGGSGPTPTPTPSELIKVHVLGAVSGPGVVELPTGARVEDAIAAAGGLTGRARLGGLNLAQPVGDGQQVYIAGNKPGKSSAVNDPGSPPQPSGGVGSGAEEADGSESGALIDLNTASAEELEALPGVGPVTAEAILAWREEHGRFSAIVELQEVSGIGPKTYADLEPLVTV